MALQAISKNSGLYPKCAKWHDLTCILIGPLWLLGARVELGYLLRSCCNNAGKR